MPNGTTYIASLITPEDERADGLRITDSGPLFIGNIAVTQAIIFPDGSIQKSAGTGLPNVIDGGTF